MVTVAVDAGGADLGPREVAAGAARAAAEGIGVLLFGPAGEMGPVSAGVEVVDAPVSIAKQADPAYAVRTTPDASIVQATRAVAEGRAAGVRDRWLHRIGAGRRPVQPPPRPWRLPSRARPAAAQPGRIADPAARRRGQRRLPPGAPGPVRAHGLGLRPGGDGHQLAPGRAALQRRGAGQGHAGPGRRARAARGLARRRPELHRQHRGHAGRRGRGRRRGHGRLHRQRHAEADRGRLQPRHAARRRRRPARPPAEGSPTA